MIIHNVPRGISEPTGFWGRFGVHGVSPQSEEQQMCLGKARALALLDEFASSVTSVANTQVAAGDEGKSHRNRVKRWRGM